mmetsp:Transcript_30910/g.79393  ORF Transcript_30910/g.79393 Transcript_30910/m.79393 type:complete len:108 (+) Transcript_30910:1785-2108(+)
MRPVAPRRGSPDGDALAQQRELHAQRRREGAHPTRGAGRSVTELALALAIIAMGLAVPPAGERAARSVGPPLDGSAALKSMPAKFIEAAGRHKRTATVSLLAAATRH